MKIESGTFYYLAGPCVIEDEAMTFGIAETLKTITESLPVEFVFKASFDKANRTSVDSFRGPGLDEGLRILEDVKSRFDLRVMSDVHDVSQVAPAAEVLDIIQIPAFLCRQTDLLVAVGATMKAVNLKKGQFVAPEDMAHAIRKVESSGNENILLTERGTTFGYHNLVVDYRSFSVLSKMGYPVVFDATHAVQLPSQGGESSGERQYVAPLARAAVAYGVDGLFTEVHPDPAKALCDGANSIPLDEVEAFLRGVLRIRAAAKEEPSDS